MVIKSKSSSSRGDGSMKEEEKVVVHYKGVRMRRWGSWVSEIRAPNQKTRIWLGSYSTQEAAARAYDAALLCLKGSSASFNFPAAAFSLHVPPTPHLSAKSIQRLAAAAAANASTTTTTTTTLSPSPSPSPSLSSLDTSGCCTASPAAVPEECVDIDSWLDSAFQSHKFMELMMLGGGGAFFDPLPQVVEECSDDVRDIRLWSF